MASPRASAAAKADARQMDLTPRSFRTQFGGVFLFLVFLARIPLDAILRSAGFPGTKMIPAEHAMRSLLALKLFCQGVVDGVTRGVADCCPLRFSG